MVATNVVGVVYGFYMPQKLESLPCPCGMLELFSEQLQLRVTQEEFERWERMLVEIVGVNNDGELPGTDLYWILRDALDYLHVQGDIRLHPNMIWSGVGVSVGGWTKDDRGNGVLPSGNDGNPLSLHQISKSARKTLDKPAKQLIASVGKVVGRKPRWVLLDSTG